MSQSLLSFSHWATFLLWLRLLGILLSFWQIFVNVLLVSGNKMEKKHLFKKLISDFLNDLTLYYTIVSLKSRLRWDTGLKKWIKKNGVAAAAWEWLKLTKQALINHSKLAAKPRAPTGSKFTACGAELSRACAVFLS